MIVPVFLWSAAARPWLAFGGIWLLFLVVAVLERIRPVHADPRESKDRLVANFGLGLANAGIALALPLSAVAAAEWARRSGFGLLNHIGAPLAAAAATILLWSLLNYLLHRAAHGIPILWRLHRVHHCDTAVDLSTGFRNHPGEALVLAALRSAAAILLGASVPALVVYETIGFAFELWTHANLDLPAAVDRPLRWILVTPAMHHVHHSAYRPETDSNYSDVLSFWDRLFGTYCELDEIALRTLRFGLGEPHDAGAGSLGSQILAPFRRSQAGEEGGDIGAKRIDRIAALHQHERRQPE
ncbi:MAG TPA: sterol desaturase family protein [Allosphingosinicella sp.]|jgi:sterol desaturase/sphingolipid hydroxylase (fatty acid hydroxylase superfamily)|nr:sterol desaturase family protein [Allosphingosinicella sp.]